MNMLKIEIPDLNKEKIDMPILISRFLEKIAEDNEIDVQDIMIWYNKRSGILEVIKDRQSPIILGTIEVNDF